MQESEKRKFLFLLGIIASGVVTTSFVLTMVLTSLQLFVLMPVESFDELYGDKWQLANVSRFDLKKATDFRRAEQTLIFQVGKTKDTDPVPYFLLGELYQTLNRNGDALAQYQKALSIAEKGWYNRTIYQYLINNAHAAQAIIYYESRKSGAALTSLQQIRNLELYPPSASDWASDPFEGTSLRNYKHYSPLAHKQATAKALRDVLENPDRADFHLTLARCFSRGLKLDLAREEAETAIRLGTDPALNLQAHHFLTNGLPMGSRAVSPLLRYYTLAADANEYMNIDLASAANFYEEAIRENPRLEWSYHHLGMVYRKLKDYTRAMRNARKAADINPGFYLSYLTMGDIELDRENYRAAIQHFNQARRIVGGIPRQALEDMDVPANIENQLGFSYELLDDMDEAIQHYGKALDLASEDSEDYEYAQSALIRLKSLNK